MLKKILKHDSLAILRRLLPLFIVQLSAGALLMVLALVRGALLTSPGTALLDGILGALSGLLWMSVFILFVITDLLVYHQYFRSMFTDEGYLTMVIPVSTHRLLLGKLLCGFLWSLTATVIALLSVLLGLLPTLMQWIPAESLLWLLEGLGTTGTDASGGWLIPFYILTGAVSLVYQHLLIYCAITLGGCFFKKHKYVGAILFYYIVSMLTEMLTVIPTVIFAFVVAPLLHEALSLLLIILLFGAVAVGLYFLTHRVLHRHFNLE